MEIDEQYLLVKSTKSEINSAIQKLISQIKQNQFEQIKTEKFYILKESKIVLPKEKEIIETKTKWAKFAERKGIEKKKKSFFVRDENDKIVHRYGAMSQKNLELRSGVYKEGTTYSKMRREKEKRVKKNLESMKKNIERSKENK